MANNGGESIWAANEERDSPSLRWNQVQPLLETAVPHVLIILDCCYAGTAARDICEGTTKEILAACGRENPTTGVCAISFTSALIDKLDAFGSSPFTACMLHSRLVTDRWRLQSTPFYVMLSEGWGDSIQLNPRPAPLPDREPPPRNPTRVLLAVSIAQEAALIVRTSLQSSKRLADVNVG